MAPLDPQPRRDDDTESSTLAVAELPGDQVVEVSIEDVSEDGRGLSNALLRLAIPTTTAGWLKASFLFADTWSAGRISTVALAGLSAAVFFVWMYHSLSTTNSAGALCHVSQARGRKDNEAVRAAWTRGTIQAFFLGIAMSVLFLAVTPLVVGVLSLDADVVAQARSYLIVIALVGPGYWVFDTLEQNFRAVGDAKTPLVVVTLFALLNLGLNPVLALGWGPIPALGLVGIGVATGVAWIFGAVVLGVLAVRRGYIGRSSASAPSLFAFIRVGAPTAISMVGFDLIWVLMVPLLAVGGAAAIAAVSIGHRLESVAWLTAQGLGAEAAALVGQSVGANRAELGRKVALRATVLSFAFAGGWAALLILFGDVAIGIFSKDPEILSVGLDYIALAVFALVFQTAEVIFFAAFAGAGRTGIPSLVTLATYATRWPLAYMLVPSWGIAGVFAAIGITAALAGILVAAAFLWTGPGTKRFARVQARSEAQS